MSFQPTTRFLTKDLAYAAGLFDGEGCVLIAVLAPNKQRHYPSHNLRVSIGMTNPNGIYPLQKLFGGQIRQSKAKYAHWKDSYTWMLYQHEAAAFLLAIRPYTRVKSYEVWLALEFLAQRTKSVAGKPLSDEELSIREGYKFALQQAKISV